jgi:hypothetical protein
VLSRGPVTCHQTMNRYTVQWERETSNTFIASTSTLRSAKRIAHAAIRMADVIFSEFEAERLSLDGDGYSTHEGDDMVITDTTTSKSWAWADGWEQV